MSMSSEIIIGNTLKSIIFTFNEKQTVKVREFCNIHVKSGSSTLICNKKCVTLLVKLRLFPFS
jgi:hypothetical protein